MAVVAISGGPGAPGATTTALALLLAWPLAEGRRVVLLECDPDGGAVLAGALEGRLDAGYGLRHLAVADRRGRLAETLWEQLVDLSRDGTGNRLLLPGLTDPAQAPGLAYTWEPLVAACHDLDAAGCDVIVDLGRNGAHGASAPLARGADAVLVTVRTTLRGLSAARPRVAALAADLDANGTGSDALGLILVHEGPYAAAEVGKALGAPVLGLLPHEPRSARVLSDGGDSGDRRFVRSALMRAVRSTADEVRLLTGRRRLRLGTASTAAAAPVAPQAAPFPQPEPYQPQPQPDQYQPHPEGQPAAQPQYPYQPEPQPQPAPLAGFAPRQPVPQPFAPPTPGGPSGPGQEMEPRWRTDTGPDPRQAPTPTGGAR
ncbi:hypothetical protein ABUW04_15215 [Streptacidiphilus sp. N1-10]|uniref:Cellulose biosynthesis protein BcsQ n=1 Tax=Streptacidiphilus jeojiensis TaxID=3229225 RepID=A0ABV6XMW2_9ACTN